MRSFSSDSFARASAAANAPTSKALFPLTVGPASGRGGSGPLAPDGFSSGTSREADRLLAEGCPVLPDPTHPTWRPNPEACDVDGARIELGFQKYVQRDVDGKSAAAVLADDAEPELLEPSYEVVVCHGNVIRYWVMRALQLNPKAWLRTSHANCGITHLVVKRDGGVALMGFGDAGFHPPKNVTFN